MNILRQQRNSRARLARAVRTYSALRGAIGAYSTTVPVVLRDGTPAIALVTIDLVPSPES